MFTQQVNARGLFQHDANRVKQSACVFTMPDTNTRKNFGSIEGINVSKTQFFQPMVGIGVNAAGRQNLCFSPLTISPTTDRSIAENCLVMATETRAVTKPIAGWKTTDSLKDSKSCAQTATKAVIETVGSVRTTPVLKVQRLSRKGVHSKQTAVEVRSNPETRRADDIVCSTGIPVAAQFWADVELRTTSNIRLKFYTDSLYIDQLRGGVNTGGTMTRKRTIHNLRDIARKRQSEWWARLFDETLFMYLSGARGVNSDFIEDTSFTGYAGNSFVSPDSQHILFGGGATAYNSAAFDSSAKMTTAMIDKAIARADTMGGGTSGVPALEPCKIDGEPHYVLVMHPWQEYDLRVATATGTWLDIQKAAAAAEGKNSPLFKGGLGMYNNVILHKHKGVVRFSNYGSGGTVAAGRALFLGRQAGVVAFGSPGTGLRFDWHEEMEDRGNQVVITTSSIFGVKKTAFSIGGTSRDFGVIALDTACADPS